MKVCTVANGLNADSDGGHAADWQSACLQDGSAEALRSHLHTLADPRTGRMPSLSELFRAAFWRSLGLSVGAVFPQCDGGYLHCCANAVGQQAAAAVIRAANRAFTF